MAGREDADYLLWNGRVALFWFTKPTGCGATYLTVTPASLALAAWECDGVQMTPEQAEDDLLRAVRAFYAQLLLTDDGVTRLASVVDGYPLCLAFLAVSVLAAHHMRADGANRSTAYYARLAQLLECPYERQQPKGLSREAFAAAWDYASAWAAKHAGNPLFVPRREVLRKYVAYPLAHVGLREVDLAKLPEFFESAGYAPGAAVSGARLEEDLARWLQGSGRLTRAGLAALEDERRELVVLQAVHELRAWTGAAIVSGRRVAQVELALDLPRGVPKLSYMARRPPGFPEVFEHGGHRFDSLDEGWYDPVAVPARDGDQLREGFEWVSAQTSPTFVLRRAPAAAVAFAESEDYAGYASRRCLVAGVDCAILFHESVAVQVRGAVAALTTKAPNEVTARDMPQGWHLLTGVRAGKSQGEARATLPALEVEAAVDLMMLGGLRIGRRAEWLLERPPRLVLSGADECAINGRPTAVGPTGAVAWRSASTAGAHVIEASRSKWRLTLVEADLADGLAPLSAAGCAHRPIALARGAWVVLGEDRGQVFHANLSTHTVVRPGFRAVWAILNGRPGCVLFLDTHDVQPRSGRAGPVELCEWTRAIQTAAARDTPLVALESAAAPAAQRSWTRFVTTATSPPVARGSERGGRSGAP